MTIPSTPANDPDSSARAGRIDKARQDYVYDFSNAGILFAEKVPKGTNNDLSPRYVLQVAEIAARIEANKLAGGAQQKRDAIKQSVESARGKTDGSTTVDGRPIGIEEYAEAISLLPEPLGLSVYDEDWAFGWQRVAGENAHMLQQVRRLPDHFPVTEAHFEQALGTRAEGDSLEEAMANGRVFLTDYAKLDGMPQNTSGGVQHFMYAPLGLFAVEKTGARRLMPVAIQCAQTPSAAAPIFTPIDGRLWTLAKQCLQVADMTVHGQIYHFGYCHILLEALILSSHRNLADNHPLLVLLLPHFEFTLGANNVAKGMLLPRGGYIDRLLGGSLDAGNTVMKDATRAVEWRDLIPVGEFEAMGTADATVLPSFPWRDDGLLSWPIVLEFVRGYVDLYYESDASVADDSELRAWLTEIGADDGARLSRFVDPAEVVTRDVLATLMAGVIYRATVYHAAINYAGYDWQLYAPNKSGSGYALAPTRSTVDSDDSLRAMLPSTDLVYVISKLLLQQRELKLTRMMHYSRGAFSDPRVKPLLDKAQADLKEVDATIATRNLSRPLVYGYAAPANVPNSIMV